MPYTVKLFPASHETQLPIATAQFPTAQEAYQHAERLRTEFRPGQYITIAENTVLRHVHEYDYSYDLANPDTAYHHYGPDDYPM